MEKTEEYTRRHRPHPRHHRHPERSLRQGPAWTLSRRTARAQRHRRRSGRHRHRRTNTAFDVHHVVLVRILFASQT